MDTDFSAARQRRVRSYVRRERHFTPAQQKALRLHWPRYGLCPGALHDWMQLLSCDRSVALEIGFGNGEVLLELAMAEPDIQFLGIEVHRPGIGRLLLNAAKNKVSNLRVIQADAAEVVAEHLPESALNCVLILFPDPWPKQRHHKRRLVTASFLNDLAECMQPGAALLLATDLPDYAEQMHEAIRTCPRLEKFSGSSVFCRRPDWLPETAFERRSKRENRQASYLACRKI